jgi:hypothetical protein
MPRGDGTGPLGMGPTTGRGAGACTGYNVAGYANPWFGRGYFCRGGCFGRGDAAGSGRGFKWQNWYNATGQPFWARGGQPSWNWPQGQAPQCGAAPMDKESEIALLNREASALEEELKQIKARLENLTKDK